MQMDAPFVFLDCGLPDRWIASWIAVGRTIMGVHKYLRLYLDNRLDWCNNSAVVLQHLLDDAESVVDSTGSRQRGLLFYSFYYYFVLIPLILFLFYLYMFVALQQYYLLQLGEG